MESTKITLICTTFNRATQLSRTLQRLSMLTKPDEIVLVDDGSWDTTRDVVEQGIHHWGLNINYIYRHLPTYDSCCIARNIGLKAAKGEWIITCEPEVLYVTDVVRIFRDTVAEFPTQIATQGVLYFTNPTTPFLNRIVTEPHVLLDREWDVRPFPHHTVENYPDSTVVEDHPISPFTAIYKAEWLWDIGGWDEDFSILNGGGGWGYEDIDLITRLRIKGHNQQLPPEAKVIHQWHERPSGGVQDGWKRNEDIMINKRLSVNGVEDPSHPELIANKGREWGVITCNNKSHEFCKNGRHCHTCEPEKANVGHQCVWGQR